MLPLDGDAAVRNDMLLLVAVAATVAVGALLDCCTEQLETPLVHYWQSEASVRINAAEQLALSIASGIRR